MQLSTHNPPAAATNTRWPIELGVLRSHLAERAGDHPLTPDGKIGDASLLCPPKGVADDTLKILIRDGAGQPAAVMLCSSPADPDRAARDSEISLICKRRLGQGLGQVVLEPLLTGTIEGMSYVVLPYRRPTTKSMVRWLIQRRMLAPIVLRWLRQVTELTVEAPSAQDLAIDFDAPLARMASAPHFHFLLRARAEATRRRLRGGEWKPMYVLAHNDFWAGNLLLTTDWPWGCWRRWSGDPPTRFPFVAIDWGASLVHGHALYDLMRIALTLRVPLSHLRREIHAHCRILRCEPNDAMSHLIAALAHVSTRLGHLPPERFARTAHSCYQILAATLGRREDLS
jgi:hypothetical protein